MARGPRKKPLEFGSNPDHVTIRWELSDYSATMGVRLTVSFVGSVAFVEVCALLSAILVVRNHFTSLHLGGGYNCDSTSVRLLFDAVESKSSRSEIVVVSTAVLVTLRAELSLAAQCVVIIGPVCVWVCLWVCYHDNSKRNCVHRSSPYWVCR